MERDRRARGGKMQRMAVLVPRAAVHIAQATTLSSVGVSRRHSCGSVAASR